MLAAICLHFFLFCLQNLAAEKTYNNLDVTLRQANEHRNEWFEGVHTCKKFDSLFSVMETIVKAEVHRLVVVDEDNKVCGVISLSDILSFLVLRPSGMLFHVTLRYTKRVAKMSFFFLRFTNNLLLLLRGST